MGKKTQGPRHPTLKSEKGKAATCGETLLPYSQWVMETHKRETDEAP